MNCTCVKDTERRIVAAPFIKAKAGERVTAECQATGFAMTEDMDLRAVLNIPFLVRGSGKGYNTVKGKLMPVVASYCPFCGRSTKRYVVGEDAGLAAALGGAV